MEPLLRKGEEELDKIMFQKFSHLSNHALVHRINSRFKAGLNDDDEVHELFRRSQEQGFKVIPEWDTYRIEEAKL